MTTESSWPPCERFTVLESRTDARATLCDVCDQTEAAHENPGQRRLAGGKIEELRRRMIEDAYDKLAEQGPRHEGDRPI
jgi:hypothetical protein